MARREARGSRGKLAAAVLLVAIAAASAFAIRTIAAGFNAYEQDNARAWIAADVMTAYIGLPPSTEQWAAIRSLDASVESTLVTEIPASFTSAIVPVPIVGTLKVVDPKAYPYYGRLDLKTGRDLKSSLSAHSVAASLDVLEALQLHLGDEMRINGTVYIVGDIIGHEPDRWSVPAPPTGRIVLSQEGFRRLSSSGLPTLEAIGSYRLLMRTPITTDRRTLCVQLENIFPGARVIDYTSRTPETAAVAEFVLPFLNIAEFLCIVLGAIGVAAAIHFHLLRSIDTLAVLKSLGATTARIVSIYLSQVVAVALVGGLLGLVGGRAVESLLSELGTRYLEIEVRGANRLSAGIETVVFTLLIAIVAAWVPLSRIRLTPASILLRRDFAEKLEIQRSLAQRVRPGPLAVASGVALAAITTMLPSHSWGLTAIILAACVAGSIALAALGQFAIWIVFRAIQPIRDLPWFVRHGTANLYRYRRQSRMVVVGLATSIACMMIALLGQTHLRTYLLDALPFHSPNLLVIRIDGSRRASLSRALEHLDGVEAPPQFIPTTWVSLSRVGDSSLQVLRNGRPQSWIQKDWPAGCSSTVPPLVTVVAGHWWSPDTRSNVVAIDQSLAKLFGIGVGSRVEFAIQGLPVSTQVGAIVRIPAAQRAWWREIIFNCQVIPHAMYTGAISVAPDRLPAVQRFLHDRFPNVMVMSVDDLLRRTQRVANDAIQILKIVGWAVACLAACLMLAVIGSLRAFRVYEIAMLRMLGASTLMVVSAIAAEYLLLGALAGLFGAGLGSLAAAVILRHIAGTFEWILDIRAITLTAICASAVAVLVGVLGSLPLLQSKPLEVLRRR